ncbi:ATP-binding cassette domain-containing protein [Mesorhizobium sp. M0006]|uniref:ATP-binding cassette domain-containing protein n=1 Tax=Mesorhizobium sp. M0006 TaxID=2956838 RepID=UPI00333B437E
MTHAAEQVSALEVRSLSHLYGAKRVLNHVSFSVPRGSFTVLLGRNGAGKTTLFSLITRLFSTSQDAIRIFGFDVNRTPSEALKRLGVVFQARTLDLDLTVRQNLGYHASLHGIGPVQAKSRIAELLEIVGMSDRQNDKARSLSGGQMRRIEIARALLHRPPLLLLDEATVGLDVHLRAGILATIRGLVKEDDIGVLWATHLIDEVIESDHVVILEKGDVLAKGGVLEVVRQSGSTSIGEMFSQLTDVSQPRSVKA